MPPVIPNFQFELSLGPNVFANQFSSEILGMSTRLAQKEAQGRG
jgi:hypothetical protein